MNIKLGIEDIQPAYKFYTCMFATYIHKLPTQ
jgi:hypothetical protein